MTATTCVRVCYNAWHNQGCIGLVGVLRPDVSFVFASSNAPLAVHPVAWRVNGNRKESMAPSKFILVSVLALLVVTYGGVKAVVLYVQGLLMQGGVSRHVVNARFQGLGTWIVELLRTGGGVAAVQEMCFSTATAVSCCHDLRTEHRPGSYVLLCVVVGPEISSCGWALTVDCVDSSLLDPPMHPSIH